MEIYFNPNEKGNIIELSNEERQTIKETLVTDEKIMEYLIWKYKKGFFLAE